MKTQDQTIVGFNGRLSSPQNSPKKVLRDLTQRFSRFLWFRKSYSLFRNLQQRFNIADYKDYLRTGCQCFFSNLPVDSFVKEVDKNAVAFGLQLPESIVEKILHYATCAPCTEPGYDKSFLINELDQHNYLPDGHRVTRAHVNDVTQCQAVNVIAQDSLLLQIASTYLHYYPTQVTCHLTWSIASNLTEDEVRASYPASNFHYDIAGYNFATTYSYITPVLDDYSGPHVMIKGSHKRKPLWMLLKSGRCCDEKVYAYYGKEDEIYIKGKAGFTFFQDPSCIHRVKAPTSQNRLLLQIRYS
jgi:hypothetical protein